MFSHLTLLNHHKRIHTQDGTDGTNDQQITVVTQQAGQNLVQGNNNNLMSQNGQNLANIQIVTSNVAMDQQVQGGDHQQHHHHQQQVSNLFLQFLLNNLGIPSSPSDNQPKYYRLFSIINNSSNTINSITLLNSNIMPVCILIFNLIKA